MPSVTDVENKIVAGWIDNGTYDAIYESYKRYADADQANDYRGTSLLELARKNKERIGLSDEEISKSPIQAKALMSMLKLAAYEAPAISSALEGGDSKEANRRDAKVQEAVSGLANYTPENRDTFIKSFMDISALPGGKATTFGEETRYDNLKHKVGIWDEFTSGFADASVLTNLYKLTPLYNEKDAEASATKREIIRTGGIESGFVGTVASTVGTASAFLIESLMASKLGKAAGGLNLVKQQKYSDYIRWGAQGALLPVLQNVNDQVGLTQQYVGDNEIENHIFKLFGDASHNLLGMIAGDKILSPLIQRAVAKSGLTGFSKNAKTLKGLRKSLLNAGDNLDDVIARANTEIEKMPLISKEFKKILSSEIASGKFSENALAKSLDSAWKVTLAKGITKPTIGLFTDVAADFTFDVLSHNALNMATEAIVDSSPFTVHQNRMFDFESIAKSPWESIKNSMIQRLSLRAASRVLGQAKKLRDLKVADKDTEEYVDAGSYKWYKEQGLDKEITGGRRIFVFLNEMINENYYRGMDSHMQATSGRGMADIAKSTDESDQILNVVNTFFAREHSNNNALLWLTESIDSDFSAKRFKQMADLSGSQDIIDRSTALIINSLPTSLLRIKDIGSNEKIEKMSDYLISHIPETEEGLRKIYDTESIGGDATKANAKMIANKSADTDTVDKLVALINNIHAKGDLGNEVLQKVIASAGRKVKERIGNVFPNADITTVKSLESFVKNEAGSYKSRLTPATDEAARSFLKSNFSSDVESGDINAQQKADIVEMVKAKMAKMPNELEEAIEKRFDRSATARIIGDISKKIAESKSGDIENLASTYDFMRLAISDKARDVFNDYRDKIRGLVTNSKGMTDQGVMRRVFSNTYMAYNLARTVGHRWTEDVKDFARELKDNKELVEILNRVSKNTKWFEGGNFRTFKQEWIQSDDFGARMTTELFNEIAYLKQAKNTIFPLITKQMNTVKQYQAVVGPGSEFALNQDSALLNRVSKPLFTWHKDIDKVNITHSPRTGMGESRITSISDSETNDLYATMISNINRLDTLPYDENHVVKLMSSAGIKAFDFEVLAGKDKNTFRLPVEIGNAKMEISFANGEYQVKTDFGRFDWSSQENMKEVYSYSNRQLSRTRNLRDQAVTSPNNKIGRFDIKGKSTTIDQFVKNLDFKGLVNGFSFDKTAIEIMSMNRNRNDSKDQIMDFIGILDPTLLRSSDDHNKVSQMIDQYITDRAMRYAFDIKFDLKMRDDIVKISNYEVSSTNVGSVTSLLDGRLNTVNINFDEKIPDITDPKILGALRGMNVIWLNKQFKNDLSPIFMQVEEVGTQSRANKKEFGFVKNMLKDVLDTRYNNSPVKQGSYWDKLRSVYEEYVGITEGRKGADDALGLMRHMIDSGLKIQRDALRQQSGVLKPVFEGLPKDEKNPKVVAGIASEINKIIEVSKDDTEIQNFANVLKKRMNQMKDIDMTKLDDDQIAKFNSEMLDIIREVRITEEKLAGKFIVSPELLEIQKSLAGGFDSAYYKTDDTKTDYRVIKEFKSAFEDTVKATDDSRKDYNSLDRNDSDALRGMFYSMVTLGEAAFSTKNIEKRASYFTIQDKLMKDGTILGSVDEKLSTMLDDMDASGGKIYLTSGNQDGMNYVNKEFYNIMQLTYGNTGGKLTNNSMFGGKFMFRDIDPITKTEQKIQVVGEDGFRTINNKDILLDITSLKTMFPDFVKLLDFKQASGEQRKGNALEIVFPDPAIRKQMLGSLSLHAALKGSAKKVEPSSQLTNIQNKYEQGLSNSMLKRSSEMAYKKLKEDVSVDEVILDAKKMEGKVLSYFNRGYGTGAGFVAEYAQQLKLGTGNRDDIELYSDGDPIIRNANGEQMIPGAEAHIGTGALAEMLREYYANNSKDILDSKYKTRVKAIIDMLSKIDRQNFDDVIESIRDSATTWSRVIDEDTYMKLQDKKGNFRKAGDRYENILTNQEVFEDAIWSAMYTTSGFTGKDSGNNQARNNKGSFSAFVPEWDKKHENGNKKNVFLFNATRFPNHNVGQNTMVFLKGVTVGGQGVEIKNSWFTKIFGGDWDGDMLTIQGIDSSMLKNTLVNGSVVFGDNDQDVLNSIGQWHNESMLISHIEDGLTIKGDPEKKGISQNVGEAISPLGDASFTSGYFKIRDGNELGQRSFEEIFEKERKKISDRPGSLIDEFVYNPAITNVDYHTDLVISDPIMTSPSGKVNLHGAIREARVSQAFTVAVSKNMSKDYKVATGVLKSSGQYTPVVMLLEVDSKDFGLKLIEANASSTILKEPEKNMLIASSHSLVTQIRNNLAKQYGKVANIDKAQMSMLGELSNAYSQLSGLQGFKKSNFFSGKRIMNIGMLNKQMNSAGVDNVKHGGLAHMKRNLPNGNVAGTVSELARKIIVASNYSISGTSAFNAVLDNMTISTSKLSGDDKEAAVRLNETMGKNTTKFIDSVFQKANDGWNGYMTFDDYKAFSSLKKRKVAPVQAYLEGAALVDKYNTSLFNDDKVLTSLPADVQDIVGIASRLSESLMTPKWNKGLTDRMSDDLKQVIDDTRLMKIFQMSEILPPDEDVPYERKINYGEELARILSLEKVLSSNSIGVTVDNGIDLHSRMLKHSALVGKDIARIEEVHEQIRTIVNNTNTEYSSIAVRNVDIDSKSEIANLISEMGLELRKYEDTDFFTKTKEAFTERSGVNQLMIEDLDNMKNTPLFGKQSQYRWAIAGKGKIENLTLSQLYAKLSTVTYDTKHKNYAERILIVKSLINMMDEGQQYTLAMYDRGANGTFISMYEEQGKNGNIPKWSKEDLKRLSEERRKGISEKLNLFDTEVTTAVRGQLENTMGATCE